MSAGLDLQQLLDEPEGLAGFIEIAGAIARDTCAVLSDDLKLLAADGVFFLGGFFPGKCGIALSVDAGGLTGQNYGLQEMRTAGIVSVPDLALKKCFGGLGLDGFKSLAAMRP